MKRRHLEFEMIFISYMVIAFVSGTCSFFILKMLGLLAPEFFESNLWLSVVFPLSAAEALQIIIVLTRTEYHFKKFTISQCMANGAKATFILGACWALFLLMGKTGVTNSRHYFVLTLWIDFVLITIEWIVIVNIFMPRFKQTKNASMVGVITDCEHLAAIVGRLKSDWARKVVGIYLIDDKRECFCTEYEGIKVIVDAGTAINYAQRNAIDEVFVEVSSSAREYLEEVIREHMKLGVRMHINIPEVQKLEQSLTERSISSVEEYKPAYFRELKYGEGRPVLIFDRPIKRMRATMLKRAMDIVGGIVGCFITGVLIITVGIAIKLDSPGPIFFVQERIGKNGRRFKMYKFRSMYQDADRLLEELLDQNEMSGLMFKMDNDPRITKIGKFLRKTSLDEFPQFWNVLKGDMSLVGTRPPTVREFNEYNCYHKRRLNMKPGITGLWQVSGRSDITDFEEIVKLDCRYIDSWTIWGDTKILLKTIKVVLEQAGAK